MEYLNAELTPAGQEKLDSFELLPDGTEKGQDELIYSQGLMDGMLRAHFARWLLGGDGGQGSGEN